MNLKTTILLIILVAAAGWGGYYWHYDMRTPPSVDSPSAQFFDNELKPDRLDVRSGVTHGPHKFVLELPGMQNGRCKMHGGMFYKSETHGGTTLRAIRQRKQERALLKEMKEVNAEIEKFDEK